MRTTQDIREEEIHSCHVQCWPYQTTVVTAFQTVYPPALGTRTSVSLSDADKDGDGSQVLRLMKTTKIWNSNNDTDDHRVLITEQLRTKIPQPHIMLAERLSTDPPCQQLSTFLLQSAQESWKTFGDKIEHYHEIICTTKYGGIKTNGDNIVVSGDRKQDCWQMVL